MQQRCDFLSSEQVLMTKFSDSFATAMPPDVWKASGLPESGFDGLGLCPDRGVAPSYFLRIAGRPEAFRSSDGRAGNRALHGLRK